MTEFYCVADHIFSLTMQSTNSLWNRHTAYTPFQIEDCSDNNSQIFNLTVKDGVELTGAKVIHLEDNSNDDTIKLDLYIGDSSYFIELRNSISGFVCARISISFDYKDCAVSLFGSESEQRIGLENALIVSYMFSTMSLKTLFIHASSVIYNGRSYLFIAKSGTGKSTHSQMWLKAFSDAELMNDDHPIIRIHPNGEVIAYGSPWSGKTPCYKAISAPLGALVRVRRAEINRLIKLPTFQAYGSIMTSCAGVSYIEELADRKSETLDELISKVPCYIMECKAEVEAAQVCQDGLSKI